MYMEHNSSDALVPFPALGKKYGQFPVFPRTTLDTNCQFFHFSTTFPSVVVFVVASCIVYVLAVVVSFIVVFLYCVCALNVCNVCYVS
jgi:hypothetical protein